MFKFYKYNSGDIIYSIVTPIYNQESIIVKNIKSFIEHTVDNFEIILILDFCFDETEKLLIDFLDNYKCENNNLIQIKIFKNVDKPLFETKCDNIGFKNSEGKYCLEIQADMEMTEYGYNLILVKPFNQLNNVIAVSGRCAHSIFRAPFCGIGKLSETIEKSIDELNIDRNKFYSMDTCNRGPLLLDKKKLSELGYLDETKYFLDNSDHDLMIRAYLSKGYICGYVPIDFKAPLCDGSTRNKNTYNKSIEYIINEVEKRKLQKNMNPTELYKYIPYYKTRKIKIYNLT
jgi:glycosyltransferase involved in cell wall biosynthesis